MGRRSAQATGCLMQRQRPVLDSLGCTSLLWLRFHPRSQQRTDLVLASRICDCCPGR